MKKLLKSEVCGSREQCTGPIGVYYSWRKVNNHSLKKKRKKKEETQMQNVLCFTYPNRTYVFNKCIN